MTEFGDMPGRMTVSVWSPDRSVTLVATSTGPATVEFAAGTFTRHNEETLARQLAGVIRVGVAAADGDTGTTSEASLR